MVSCAGLQFFVAISISIHVRTVLDSMASIWAPPTLFILLYMYTCKHCLIRCLWEVETQTEVYP